jgi:glycosyltransferase involved in cell wall biosynthesis
MQHADVYVAHGLWQHPLFATGHAAQSANKPFLVFPHGMLDPWALSQSRTVKAVAWLAGMGSLLNHRADALCFTTLEEKELAAPKVGHSRCPQVIVPLGVDAPAMLREDARKAFVQRHPATAERQILLFLGRLHPKKGCDLLIRAFAQCCREQDAQKRTRPYLCLAGPPCSEEYLQELRMMSEQEKLSEGVDFAFLGMLEGEAKWHALAAADALVLPSHQENFGLVVAEAMACGTPALLSDKVNTAPQVKTAGAGLMARDTAEGTLLLLQQWMGLSPEQRAEMSQRAKALHEESFSASAARAGFARLLEQMIPK